MFRFKTDLEREQEMFLTANKTENSSYVLNSSFAKLAEWDHDSSLLFPPNQKGMGTYCFGADPVLVGISALYLLNRWMDSG